MTASPTACRALAFLVAAACATPYPAFAGESDVPVVGRCGGKAEYAIRWNAADGGPATAEAALAALGLEARITEEVTVEYLRIQRPHDAPEHFTATLRERKKGATSYDLTFRYRPEEGHDAPLATWKCPLPDAKENEEADVTFLAGGATKRVCSHGCKVERKGEPVPIPAALHAERTGCANTVARLESDDFTIEEWHLAGGLVMVEVAWKGVDGAEDRDAFRHDVVDVLVAAGVKPLDRSKTDAGACK